MMDVTSSVSRYSKRAFRHIFVIATLVYFAFLVIIVAYYSQHNSQTVKPHSAIMHSLPRSSENFTKIKAPMPGISSDLRTNTVTTGSKDKLSSSQSSASNSTTAAVKTVVEKENEKSFTQASSSGPSPTKPVMAVNPKVWKFEPPTSNLFARPRGTMHPDSLNPKRTYNTEPPNLPQCHSEGDKVVSIYVESYDRLSKRFGTSMFRDFAGTGSCPIPDRAVCKFTKNDTQADAVFRFVEYINITWPLRYCRDQILIAFNSEALKDVDGRYQQLDLADVRIDHFLTSDAIWFHVCNVFPRYIRKKNHTISHDPAKRTKAVAMFVSNCHVKFRNDYMKEVLKYIEVDSYGKCFHNVNQEQTRHEDDSIGIMSQTLESYRMMFTFENMIQEDYITEKIWVAYSGGAVPVYLGHPDIYNWAPGNHTFIDPRNFAGPKELAEYMKRVAEDDDLYRYHTSNFDWDRTKRMMDKYCHKAGFQCSMCRLAYDRKSHRRSRLSIAEHID